MFHRRERLSGLALSDQYLLTVPRLRLLIGPACDWAMYLGGYNGASKIFRTIIG
jgi:hypothetical protein